MRALALELHETGFASLPQPRMTTKDFSDIDAAFGRFIDEVKNKEKAQRVLEFLSEAWRSDTERHAHYSHAPMGFRDRTARLNKEAKRYFQYSKEFGKFARQHRELLQYVRSAGNLFSLLDGCAASAEEILSASILELQQEFPGIGNVVSRKGKPPPVLLRLIQYVPGAPLSTRPHVDKSALTLHMHSNDGENERFLLAKPGKRPMRLSNMRPVSRRGGNNENALLFAGALLTQAGFDLPPTPHAALGVGDNSYRQTIVAFWLVPNLATDHVPTAIDFVDDLAA